ncbi:MAG TPA: amidohydrolase family protein, partial [Stellaceae bacterium]|nr:amidohydrolase family protein [Stellaceae bacterium]
MITRLKGGRVIDPASGETDMVRDLYLRDGRIVAGAEGARIDREIDALGTVIMAGAIDIHSHIAGGKVNLSRLLMTNDHRDTLRERAGELRSGSGEVSPTSFAIGYRYAAMGYTAAFEPAMVPVNARAAHREMEDLPIIDRGAYLMLGNDEFILRMIARGAPQEEINDYVAWMLRATASVAIKTVNPGGISAFKFNGRGLDIDEKGPYHGVTPRQIIYHLARAAFELGLPHPLHTHCNNLGIPGNIETTLATIEAAQGFPIHLT